MDTSPAAVRDRLVAFRERCGVLGLALTPQRLAIYTVLAGTDGHPGAEEIFRQIKPAMPSLSLGTVYRTLELLESHGLVGRVHGLDDQAHFDANLDHHHHLVCTRCHSVRDFDAPALRALAIPASALGGFRVESHRLHLLGTCPACQAAEG
jgi:Fur family peroxide stress response transcriptional regulator